MRFCFSGVEPRYVKQMVQDSGLRALGLDAAALGKVVEQIGAPTLEELSKPIDAISEPGHGV